MSSSFIEIIAKQNGVSVQEFVGEITLAIESAYENPNEVALNIPRKGKIPTVEEFIEYCVLNLDF